MVLNTEVSLSAKVPVLLYMEVLIREVAGSAALASSVHRACSELGRAFYVNCKMGACSFQAFFAPCMHKIRG